MSVLGEFNDFMNVHLRSPANEVTCMNFINDKGSLLTDNDRHIMMGMLRGRITYRLFDISIDSSALHPRLY